MTGEPGKGLGVSGGALEETGAVEARGCQGAAGNGAEIAEVEEGAGGDEGRRGQCREEGVGGDWGADVCGGEDVEVGG